MSTNPIPYRELTVVGFSPAPEREAWPNLVTIVFRHDDRLLFAPYRLSPAGLLGGAPDDLDVLVKRAEAGNAVALEEPLPAREGYRLWVDDEGVPKYSPKDEVIQLLSKASQDLLARGQDALQRRDYSTALKLADRALRVDEENIYALVLGAAVHRLQDREDRVRRFESAAQVIAKGFPFQHHVAELMSQCNPHVSGRPPARSPESPYKDLAKERPALTAA